MTTRPRANQTSCRTTTLPPARPTWRLASVTVLITTSPNAVTSKSQSTFSSRRRSIRSTSRRSPPRRSSRRRSHSRFFSRWAPRPGRPYRRAPRVVLPLLGLGLGDRLRGTGLAGDVEPGDPRGRARSVVVHDRPEALTEERPHHWRELGVAGHLPLIAPDEAARGRRRWRRPP